MTIPMWSLLGFATWTLLLLMATVGVYRWTRVILSDAPIASFRSDRLEGADWYQRGTRAHANCVENLPVFAAIVIAITATGLQGSVVDTLCVIVLIARVCQSAVHISRPQTDRVVAVRFLFFSVQLVCFLTLIALTVAHTQQH